MRIQWRIDALIENVKELRDIKPGQRVSLISWVDDGKYNGAGFTFK